MFVCSRQRVELCLQPTKPQADIEALIWFLLTAHCVVANAVLTVDFPATKTLSIPVSDTTKK